MRSANISLKAVRFFLVCDRRPGLAGTGCNVSKTTFLNLKPVLEKRAACRAQERSTRTRTTMYRGYWYSGLNVSTVYMYQLYCNGTPPVKCDTTRLHNNVQLGLPIC